MTANYKIDAIHEIRKFLWLKLQEAGIFDPQDYYSDNLQETIIPILPVQQSPEMSQFFSGKKHLVYDKIGISYDDIWIICNEQILFTVYATDHTDLNEIKNFMIDEFRRMDETAKDINQSEVISNQFKFHSIYIAEMSPTSPSEEMQGFLTSDIVLEVKYSRNINGSGRFA